MAFHYSFQKSHVIKLTRRQIVLYLENLANQLSKDMSMQAKLHGFKMKAPARIQKWSTKDDKRIKAAAQKRFEQMYAEADMKSKKN